VAGLRIQDVYPGSGFFSHPGSWIQGSKKHRISDPDPLTSVADPGRTSVSLKRKKKKKFNFFVLGLGFYMIVTGTP
jgi:hypothetical protein